MLGPSKHGVGRWHRWHALVGLCTSTSSDSVMTQWLVGCNNGWAPPSKHGVGTAGRWHRWHALVGLRTYCKPWFVFRQSVGRIVKKSEHDWTQRQSPRCGTGKLICETCSKPMRGCTPLLKVAITVLNTFVSIYDSLKAFYGPGRHRRPSDKIPVTNRDASYPPFLTRPSKL